MKIKYFICLILITLLFNIYQVSSAPPTNLFCFSLCSKDACSNATYDKCTACRGGFKAGNAGTSFSCVHNIPNYNSTSAKYAPIGKSDDITYDLKNDTTVATTLVITVDTLPPTISNCKTDSTYNYTYYKAANSNAKIQINHPGIQGAINFYKVRIIYAVILLDDWDDFTLKNTFVSNPVPTSISHSVKFANTSTYDQLKDVCGGGGKNQHYAVFDDQFAWRTIDTLDFELSISGNAKPNPWGIRYVVIEARLCHDYCLACNGDSNTQCSQCDWSGFQARLSGTTCSKTCPSGYGQDINNPDTCIQCQTNCSNCSDAATNCTNCNSGFYLIDTGTSVDCMNPCPTHYFGNTSGVHHCSQCDSTCQNCSITLVNCTSCYSGLYLYNYKCYSPCPPLTYNDSSVMKCFLCNSTCTTCAVNKNNCSVCVFSGANKAYLLGNTCKPDCGIGYFQYNYTGTGPNICVNCDGECQTCDQNSSYCQSCSPTYYLYGSTCNTTCPIDSNTFPDNTTWECLDCQLYCIQMTMYAYFSDSLKDQMICDLVFSSNLTWTQTDIQNFVSITWDDPILKKDSFLITYQVFSSNTMRIHVTPKGYIFIYNATFSFTTISFNGTLYYAANHYRFNNNVFNAKKSLTWFLIKAPSLSQTEKNIIDKISIMSDKIIYATTLPYVQQIKKTGVFALLMGGAQVTSTACLVNTIPAQNFYQGVRLWASFVFFDVPRWQQNSNQTKYAFVPSVQDLIKDARMLKQSQNNQERILFDTQSVDWRFQRTGYTSFFLFDSYINICLIALCWVLVIVANCCIKNKPTHTKYLGIFYSFTLKIHQISIFYISLTTLLEWIYFDAASLQRWLSFGLCLLFNAYFFFFELYIYYDMINYPKARIGNQRYEYYCLRYGSLLKNIRFQQYDPKEKWRASHWFRPYNYHILSYYKKFLMMISLPIFYKTHNAQIFVLMLIQAFEMIRFYIVWPFQSKPRNYIRLGLQLCLLLFFASIVAQSYLMAQITLSDPATLQNSVNIFYKVGWVGFCLVFLFNTGHIFVFIYDICLGCNKTNRQMMDQKRKVFYMRKLNTYQEEYQDVPLNLINKWVKLGNLNNRNIEELPDISLRIQYFKICKAKKGYEIDMKKIFEVSMNPEFNYKKENNVSTGRQIYHKFLLNRPLSPTFYHLVDDLYEKYNKQINISHLTIKTFLKIHQSQFKPGQQIKLNPQLMIQKIQIQTQAGQKKKFKLDEVLPGFPLSAEALKQLL